MGHIVFAWELGSNLGHLIRHLPIAQRLHAKGHDVTFVLKDLSRAERLLGSESFRYFQAPIWLPPSRTAPKPPQSYSEILQHFGYLSVDGLHGLVNAWRSIFDAIRPTLVIFDYAPTAQIAARGMPFHTATIGGGFQLPPARVPTPAFNPEAQVGDQRLRDSDAKVLRVTNKVLQDSGIGPLAAVHEICAADEHFLCTVPELDPYQRQAGVHYWGPVSENAGGITPAWLDRKEGQARVFVYLKPNERKLDAVLGALQAVDADAEIYIPSMPERLVRDYASPRMRMHKQPLDVASVLEGCDLCMCNGGHGTTAGAIAAGKPVLLVPQQAEQLSTALLVRQMGVGDLVKPGHEMADVASSIRRLAFGAEGARALQYSRAHPEFGGAKPVEAIVKRCDELARA